jgi:hypothetical protein
MSSKRGISSNIIFEYFSGCNAVTLTGAPGAGGGEEGRRRRRIYSYSTIL